MGVNLTAIFLIDEFDKQFDSLIDRIESRDYSPFKKFHNTIVSDGTEVWDDFEPQWYINDEKVNERPKLPDINSALKLPEGLIMRFRDDGFEVCTAIRVIIAIVGRPEIAEKAISMFKDIGSDFNVIECWVMGDDNPIYLSFREFSENIDFRSIAKNDIQKNDLKYIYNEITEGEYEGCYEVKGHFKMIINE